MTRQLSLGCYIRHSSQVPVAAVFQVAAHPEARATLSDEAFTFDGVEPLHHYTDGAGNRCTRALLPAGVSTLTYAVTAEVPDEEDDADLDAPELLPSELPDEVLQFTLASRFVQSDIFASQAWRRFGALQPGYRRVEAVMDFVWNHLVYTTGSTNALATSADVFTTGRGVCRDFAHLMVCFCRALNIPARYAHGYLAELDVTPLGTPMDFHAWVQVYLGGRWYDFDPRWNHRRKGRVLIGVGRDAADGAVVTTYGAPWLQLMTVTAHENVKPSHR